MRTSPPACGAVAKNIKSYSMSSMVQKGPTEDFVRRISAAKNEPEWMLRRRLDALSAFYRARMPAWGPDLSGLDLSRITYYREPEAAEARSWDDVPGDVRETFDKLGIPKAEREYLGGVGAQYDSGVVYHRLKESLAKKGVVFENMDTAVASHPHLVREHFMQKCVPPTDHIFAALHGAVWSGGTFIYVPRGVKVSMPLQAYFRMAHPGAAQFEHTLIIADEGADLTYIEGCSAPRFNESSLHAGCVEIFVGKGARVKYISIENWSKNTYNLNTKRAIVEEKGTIQWIGGNMGSGVTMLYPSSVLVGKGARSENLGVVIAGEGQVQDTGAKAIHLAPDTFSSIRSKSIAKQGGRAVYRGLIKVSPRGKGAVSSLVCDTLLLDDASSSNTYPTVENATKDVVISHEARIGKIGEKEIFYLQSRGLSEAEAVRVLVGGFFAPVMKELPLEYALEFNKLIDMEIEGY